jgi:hypothetical protein
MPITQDRVMAILAAADAILNAYDLLTTGLRSDMANAELGADEILAKMTTRILRSAPCSITAARTIVGELEHFRHVAHTNRKAAARRRRSRGTDTIEDAAFLAAIKPRPSRTTPHGAPDAADTASLPPINDDHFDDHRPDPYANVAPDAPRAPFSPSLHMEED